MVKYAWCAECLVAETECTALGSNSNVKECCAWPAGALEQESWSAVQVPGDSQHLVQDWAEQATQVKTAAVSPAKRAAAQTNGIKVPGEWCIVRTAKHHTTHPVLLANQQRAMHALAA